MNKNETDPPLSFAAPLVSGCLATFRPFVYTYLTCLILRSPRGIWCLQCGHVDRQTVYTSWRDFYKLHKVAHSESTTAHLTSVRARYRAAMARLWTE